MYLVVMIGGSGVGITCVGLGDAVGKMVGCSVLVPVVGAGIVSGIASVGWVDACDIITSWRLCW